ncbi:hypothetical protein BD310DRAFT_388230 [Dichomitus squalens]|uniref:Uncharacterized protein n=1 Tax=Dichomitus squalens TaxID=114155 RepID=A0A4Q9P9B2_9APHY|nr:hypothetical protein BD310DRAFT_388230 [Dichomitus squalens]
MSLDYALEDSFNVEVERLLNDPAVSDMALRSQAQEYLQVYDEPSFVEIDVPQWVRRIQSHTRLKIKYTSRRLFDTMYEAATTLRVPLGARYVSAAICACASHAKSAVTCSQDQPKSVSEALGRLASVWLAFVLWPLYIQAVFPVEPSGEDSGDTTPTGRSEDFFRNTVAYPSRRWPVLRDELYQRDRYRCFMSGAVLFRTPEEALSGVYTSDLLVTHVIGAIPLASVRLRHHDDQL